jgi:Agrobacterium tumefaciens protein Atu4866
MKQPEDFRKGSNIMNRKQALNCISTMVIVTASTSTAFGQTSRGARDQSASPGLTNHDDPRSHPYLGMWVTEDGHIRHELLPNGRYDEQRGQRKSAYQGRYWVKGNRIAYLDDTGFSADGEFRDGKFYHGGYTFIRESGTSKGKE